MLYLIQLSKNILKSSGAERDRTADLRLARAALSQLSYSPPKKKVGLGRFELPTSRLSGVRSSQLSYRPNWVASENQEADSTCLHLHKDRLT